MSPTARQFTLLGVVIAIIIAIALLQSQKAAPLTPSPNASTSTSSASPVPTGNFHELAGLAGTINAPADFRLAPLIGKKVILVDFWTYSCINCQRTLPYMNAWYDKYHQQGLEIVGVHTPEFAFEKVLANVQAGVTKYGIKYPVVLDNDYSTWTAYGNRYWPRKYLIDVDGNIVYDHIGEGGYDETETKIQELLARLNQRLGQNVSLPTDMAHPAAIVAAPGEDLSPETYFGAGRNAPTIGNATASTIGTQSLATPTIIDRDHTYFSGQWNFLDESATPNAGAKLIYKFRAKRVYLVAGAANTAHLRLLLDGKPLGTKAGADVAKDSTITLGGDRLYSLIELPDYGEHVLQIEAIDGEAQLFTFTFG